jgi:hypothetical protein
MEKVLKLGVRVAPPSLWVVDNTTQVAMMESEVV